MESFPPGAAAYTTHEARVELLDGGELLKARGELAALLLKAPHGGTIAAKGAVRLSSWRKIILAAHSADPSLTSSSREHSPSAAEKGRILRRVKKLRVHACELRA